MKSSRLKNFCEICRKQCKDENGFHCHLNSAHHQRKVREFATNPQEHIDKYSQELETRIVQMLKVKYPGEAKDAEEIYEEYAEDKYHVKFNHTYWKNLEEFIEYLKVNVKNVKVTGKFPSCKLMYTVSKANEFMNKKKEQLQFLRREQEKQSTEKSLHQRMERVKEMEEEMFRKMKERLQRQQDEQEECAENQLQMKFQVNFDDSHKRNPLFSLPELEEQANQGQISAKSKKKNVDILYEKLEQNTKKDEPNLEGEQDEIQWIFPGIMVKILPHEIPQPFHNKKVQILRIVEPYIVEVSVGSAKLQIDQTYLETVIPKLGGMVTIVKGKSRGKNGILKRVIIEKGIAVIEVDQKQDQYSFNEFSKAAQK